MGEEKSTIIRLTSKRRFDELASKLEPVKDSLDVNQLSFFLCPEKRENLQYHFVEKEEKCIQRLLTKLLSFLSY